MKATARMTTAALIGSATTAFAAGGAESDGMGILTLLFLGFGAMIIAFQLIPGVMLFCSMLKGLVTKEKPEASAVHND